MANVNIKFNGKEFLLSCDDGQEEHLEELSEHLNKKFVSLKASLGNIGENKLLLITSIKVMDEYFETKKKVEEKTKDRKGLVLNICFDYGSQYEITEAVKEISMKYKENKIKLEDINEEMIGNHLYTKDLPKLDLLIRTSGELRISNFLLWQLAYSELYFTKKLWPEFNYKQLLIAIDNYQKRNRTYGGLKEKK